jgi:hypothetical protein
MGEREREREKEKERERERWEGRGAWQYHCSVLTSDICVAGEPSVPISHRQADKYAETAL